MVTTRSRSSGSKVQGGVLAAEKPLGDGGALDATPVAPKRSSRRTGRQNQDSGSEEIDRNASQSASENVANHSGNARVSLAADSGNATLIANSAHSDAQAAPSSNKELSSHPIVVSPIHDPPAPKSPPVSHANGNQVDPPAAGGGGGGGRSSAIASKQLPAVHASSDNRGEADKSVDSDDDEDGSSSEEEDAKNNPRRTAGGVSSSDEDDELDFSSEGMLSQLADSIRAAFHAQAGGGASVSGQLQGGEEQGKEQQQQQRGRQDVDIALSEDSEDELEELEREAEKLKWRPEVQLPVASLEEEGQGATVGEKEKGLAKQLKVAKRDARQLAKAARGSAPDTAGKGWFDLPATRVSDDLKRELRLLRLRNAFDPKHHYKSFDNTAFPKYFQVGTVVEAAAEFHSSRLTNRERKSTITEEVLYDPDITRHRKRRYNQMQEASQKWSKHKRRKTDQPRDKARKPKPKH